jgi:hypothetical protein
MLIQTGNFPPQVKSLVVGMIDGDQKPRRVQPHIPGQQGPGILDGLSLEIIAKREVPEHFEKGVVARRIADVVEVIVLATGPHTFLRGRGAWRRRGLDPSKVVLERHHPGIDEQQRRIVLRDQGRRGHNPVITTAKIVQKQTANVIQTWHCRSTTKKPVPQSGNLPPPSRTARFKQAGGQAQRKRRSNRGRSA